MYSRGRGTPCEVSYFDWIIHRFSLLITLDRHVKALVGELDFSFHAVSTMDSRIAESRMTSRAPSRAASPVRNASKLSLHETQAADRQKMD